MCANRNCYLNYHNTICQSFVVKKEYHTSLNFCDDLIFYCKKLFKSQKITFAK